ncbi:MAG: T9SS type A sorting domain-containing protein [Flavobacteriales bacterium]|nr:T9SS type A sorting domain-containing protein [Flavobacteriales bacterium]
MWIICDQQDVNSEFTLCNSNGQIIRKMTMYGNTMYLETTGLPAGQYFVSFLSEGRIISKELVIQ